MTLTTMRDVTEDSQGVVGRDRKRETYKLGREPYDKKRETYDRRFDPHRIPRTDRARELVDAAMRKVESVEMLFKLRVRKRRPEDQKTFEAIVGALVCDAVHRHLTAPGKWIAVPLSNRVLGCGGRYRSRVMSQTLPHIVQRLAMAPISFLEVCKGTQSAFGPGHVTTIRAGHGLRRRMEEANLEHSDFGRGGTEELIILKRRKDDIWDNGKRIEYADTPDTEKYRQEMGQINRWLASADIDFDEVSELHSVDPSDRILRRYFNGDFTRGGRLFGGFWQQLPKLDRFRDITINGEEIVELDFGQMAPRIAYGRAGATPPSGDLYAIPGVDLRREGARDALKKVLVSMLYSTRPLTRFPRGTRKSLKGSFEGIAIAIGKYHAPIAGLFYTGYGMELMFMESEILVDVLLKCEAKGIIALPIHDALLVQRSAMQPAKALMLEVFAKHTGLKGTVDVFPREVLSRLPQGNSLRWGT